MLEINYYQWLDGDNCCQQTRGCGCEDINPCDCDEILLELSKLHTDDLILQDLIDELSGKTSGGCDCDLEDYYTKEEIDDKNFINQIKTINGQSLSGTGDVVVGTGGTIAVDDALSTTSENPVQNKVITNALNNKLDASAYTPTDLSNYYTKQQSDSYYQPKGNYLTKASGDTLYQPVGNYLTKSTADGYYQPIGNYLTKALGDSYYQPIGFYLTKSLGDAYYQPIGDYVTNTKLTQYITSLQEQIDSLKRQVSGCCGETGETYYRWVTMTGANDYWCSGTTKMSNEKQQMSTDGITWTDTGVVRSGSTVLEENSTDCGYVPPVTETKFKIWYSGGNTHEQGCDSSSAIIASEARNTPYSYTEANRIEIGNCVTELKYNCGTGTFEGMENVTDVTIPNGLTTIDTYAFRNCTSLSSITIPYSVTSIDNTAFYNNESLSILNYNSQSAVGTAFSGLPSLQTVVIGDSTPSIGNTAFNRCSGLTNVTIGNGVTSIGNQVFGDCSGLTSCTIGTGVTSIGSLAFYGCRGLTGITIPNSVTNINSGAFANCTSLTSVNIPSGVTILSNALFQNCTALSSITIPNSVTTIDDGAFYGCSGLSGLTIPNGVINIGNRAFDSCSGLTSMVFPDSVTNIGSRVFSGCSNMTSITVGAGIRSIGVYAFATPSPTLTDITIKAITPPTFGSDAFFGNSCPIYVPAESVEAYKTALRGVVSADRIQPIQ